MPFDSAPASAPAELARRTDEVIAGFGLPPTRANLLGMAEEMERRLHVFPAGPQFAWRIAAELKRRALEQRPR